MAWYDLFSTFYDHSVERVYAPYRAEIAAELGLRPGDRVLDLACGTGPNLPHLAATGAEVIGVDLSEGMLARAEQRRLDRVRLLRADARALRPEDLGGPLDGVLSTLGLSVIPEWESVLAATWALVKPGGRYVVFDIHAEQWVPASWVVERMAQADLHRKPWEALEKLGAQVEWRWLPGSPHVHGGRPFLVRATRPG